MKYKIGDILRGKVNGREFQIVESTGYYYTYKDLKSGRKFMVGCKTLERCAVEKVRNEKEQTND